MLSFLTFLAIAAPPQIEITPKGTKISQGSIIVTILPDGSVTIKSPSANLTIPAADLGPVPPVVDDFCDALKAIYGADQDALKPVKIKSLIKSYEAALAQTDAQTTVGDFALVLNKSQTLKADDLRALRDKVANELQTQLGTDPDSLLDVAKAKATLSKIIIILKGL